MVQLTRRENTPNLFGLQRLNRILDEAFAGLPFPEQGGDILTASWVPPTDVSEDDQLDSDHHGARRSRSGRCSDLVGEQYPYYPGREAAG